MQEEHVYEACREFPPYRIPDTEIADAYASVASRRAEEISGSIVRSENLRVDGRLINDLVLQGTVDGVSVREYMRLIVVSRVHLAAFLPRPHRQGTGSRHRRISGQLPGGLAAGGSSMRRWLRGPIDNLSRHFYDAALREIAYSSPIVS